MRIPIAQWAEKYFDPPPSTYLVREWAKSGQIEPPPVNVGKAWYVDENAEYVPLEIDSQASGRVKEILNATKTA
jgi:hypothetical protein